MEAYLNNLIQTLGQWNPLWAYSALLLSAFLENVIPPIPGDTVVVFSAYLVGRQVLSWWPVYLVTCAGGLAGFLCMYYLGYSQGRAFWAGRGKRFFSPERMDPAQRWLGRYGTWLILANRFLSGIRSVIAISAGIGALGWKRVAVYGLISMALWNGLLLYLGLLLGQNWQVVGMYLQQYNRLLVGLLVVGLALWGGRRWHRRKKEGLKELDSSGRRA